MKENPPAALEFSRVFPVDKLRDHPAHENIEANEKELKALARRLKIVELKNLEADFQLQRDTTGDTVEVAGKLQATVVQNCVVTLEAFESSVTEEFKAYFARKPAEPEDLDLPVEDERAPDPIPANGEIDLGELAAQHLSLALDPYPRKPGVVFEPVVEGEEIEEKPHPFAVLADFRNGKNPKKK
jgi:uncharacterized metal-binding protein YceD (DUF177 family)